MCLQLFDPVTCPSVEKYGEAISGVRVGAVRGAESCTIWTRPSQAIKGSLGDNKWQAQVRATKMLSVSSVHYWAHLRST